MRTLLTNKCEKDMTNLQEGKHLKMREDHLHKNHRNQLKPGRNKKNRPQVKIVKSSHKRFSPFSILHLWRRRSFLHSPFSILREWEERGVTTPIVELWGLSLMFLALISVKNPVNILTCNIWIMRCIASLYWASFSPFMCWFSHVDRRCGHVSLLFVLHSVQYGFRCVRG